jgi:hypothetical protein
VGPAAAAAPSEAVEVTGRGTSVQAALDDGVQSALLRVAGAYVRAETVVVNDELVSQSLRTHAKGIVERVDRKGEASLVDGFYVQPMVVHVRRAPFVAVMEEVVKASRDIDGEALAARIRALQSSNASAAELVAEIRRGFPSSVLTVTVSDPRQVECPQALARADETCMGVLVDVVVDDAKWKAWASNARAVLESIADGKVELDWNPVQAGASRVDVAQLFDAGTQSEFSSQQKALSASTVGQSPADVFGMLVERLRAEAEEAIRPDSPWVGLLGSRGGKVQFFRLPVAVHRGGWGSTGSSPAIPLRVPTLSVRILDAEGDSIGRTVPLGATAPGTGVPLAARESPGQGFGAGGPAAAATTEFRLPASYFLPPLNMPWLMCRDRRGSVVMLERLTIPVLFVVDRDAISSIRKVEASLTDSVVPWTMP